MKLAAWMQENGLDDEAVASRIRADGVTKCDRTQVGRYRRGVRRPDWDVILRLKEVSGGLVIADDFSLLEAAE